VRYQFLLDENILYHAARGVDEHDRPDKTAADLIRSIARICHGLTIHQLLLEKYWRILQKLRQQLPSASQALFFITVFMKNLAKRTLEYDELPELPAGVRIPRKDEPIVRAALISFPIIVTADEELRDAIRNQPVLGLTALNAKEALDFVRKNAADD
jgi:rRNA-processing protein FCF1